MIKDQYPMHRVPFANLFPHCICCGSYNKRKSRLANISTRELLSSIKKINANTPDSIKITENESFGIRRSSSVKVRTLSKKHTKVITKLVFPKILEKSLQKSN